MIRFLYFCSPQLRVAHYVEIFNAEVIFREDSTPDEFIDVVVGGRVYLACLYVFRFHFLKNSVFRCIIKLTKYHFKKLTD